MFTLCMHFGGGGSSGNNLSNLMVLFHKLIQFVLGLKIIEGQYLTTEFSFS